MHSHYLEEKVEFDEKINRINGKILDPSLVDAIEKQCVLKISHTNRSNINSEINNASSKSIKILCLFGQNKLIPYVYD